MNIRPESDQISEPLRKMEALGSKIVPSETLWNLSTSIEPLHLYRTFKNPRKPFYTV